MITLQDELVSIITPAYNSKDTLPETLASVRAQTYQNWELLVVIDDGTKDSTPEIVETAQQKDPRIRLLKIPKGRGLALSRNYALEQARGQYVAFLDSDDVWLPEKLKKQIDFLLQKKAAFTTHQFRRISLTGDRTGHLICPPAVIHYKDLLKHNYIGCLTVLIDQKKTGPLRFEETKHEDFLLWLKLLKAGHTCFGLSEDLARYRIVPTARSANKIEMIKMRWKILRDHEGLDLPSTFYYLAYYAVLNLKKHSKF